MKSSIILAAPLALFLAGCGSGGPTTHAVSGRVDLPGGDASALVGSHVEISSESNPEVRASGEIGEGGRFVLQTLHDGKVLRGAREGRYRVRIVPNDDDPRRRRAALKATGRRHLAFETTPTTITVPPPGEVVVAVGGT